jgi:tetratricopeptide (TPR) repeat protein
LLYNRRGEYEQAIKNLEACTREEPEYPKAYFQLSWAYRRLGNEQKATEYLDRFNQLQSAAVANTQKALGIGDKPPQQ